MTQRVVCPPDTLYHGTTHSAFEAILESGLKPMGRQRVHLSANASIAFEVGRRRDANPVLLEIDASTAFADGITFYKGNDEVWLADAIPPKYIKLLSTFNKQANSTPSI